MVRLRSSSALRGDKRLESEKFTAHETPDAQLALYRAHTATKTSSCRFSRALEALGGLPLTFVDDKRGVPVPRLGPPLRREALARRQLRLVLRAARHGGGANVLGPLSPLGWKPRRVFGRGLHQLVSPHGCGDQLTAEQRFASGATRLARESFQRNGLRVLFGFCQPEVRSFSPFRGRRPGAPRALRAAQRRPRPVTASCNNPPSRHRR